MPHDAYRRWVEDNFDYSLKYTYNPFGRYIVGLSAEVYTDTTGSTTACSPRYERRFSIPNWTAVAP